MTRTTSAPRRATSSACGRSVLDLPGFDRAAYEDRLEWELARIAKDPRAVDLEIRSCAADKLYFLGRHFMHEDIHQGGRVVRLLGNSIQLELEAAMASGQWDELVILKARKAGLSTWIDASLFWEALFRPNLRAAVIAHESDSTVQLFDRLQFAHANLPDYLRSPLQYSNRKELAFKDHHSSVRALTAGNSKIGRGSDLDRVHFSEAAFYPNLRKLLVGIGEAVRPGSMMFWESTPNGFEDFRAMYVAAREGRRGPDEPRRRAMFFPWHLDRKNRVKLEPEQAARVLSTLTDEEAVLRNVAGLDADQVAWRRSKKSTLRDAFDQEHPENDETCFLRSGTPKFNVQYWRSMQLLVQARVQPAPFNVLVRRWPQVLQLDDGNLTVWRPPVPGHAYAIGADVAEGLPRGDWSAAGVLDTTDLAHREQVAEYLGKLSPGDFGLVLARLGTWFNRARLGIERNNHGHATIRAARVEAGYSPMYRHRELDQRGRNIGRFGFPTTPGTRRTLLDTFARSCMEGEHMVRSYRLCGQCMTFQSGDEDKKVDGEREDGEDTETHDDLVFAWAIADWVALKGAFAVA